MPLKASYLFMRFQRPRRLKNKSMGNIERPKDWWGAPENALAWISQNQKRESSGDLKTNTTIQSAGMVFEEVAKRIENFKKICEVGAGDGRLIGMLSQIYLKKKFFSVDINKELSRYVGEKYPRVKTFVADIIDMKKIKKDHFDLVFTYQVLQHIPPEEIMNALNELLRITKDTLLLWEGIGRVDGYQNGAKVHNAHNGSFVHYIDQLIKCEEVIIPQNNNLKLERQRLYVIRKRK